MLNPKNQNKPVVLIILDGWGYAPSWGGNAIAEANTPNFDKLWREYPHTTLQASGEAVGLTGHERGNSEVGHLNLGTGQVMMQDVTRINQAIKNNELQKNEVLIQLVSNAKEYNSNIHLMGCLTKGTVHANISHLFALLEYFSNYAEIRNRVYLHLFTDGRDSAPQDAQQFISNLLKKMKELGTGRILTISGRYYAMDRDNHWERTEPVYNAMAQSKGLQADSALSAVSQSYNIGKTDEFIPATVIIEKNKNVVNINNHDSILLFNFRADRARQLTRAFTQKHFSGFKRAKVYSKLFFCTMVPYGVQDEFDTIKIHTLFNPAESTTCLAKVLADNNKTQFHIAETEKYAHVTYFFNGGIEDPFPKEDRILIPSPRIFTYDLAPGMSAKRITRKTLETLKWKHYDFIVINYANVDMVGHTGNYQAVVRACEIVDQEFAKIVQAVQEKNGICIITADHGNAEQMANPKTGDPDTEHTTNPVPIIIANSDKRIVSSIKLKPDIKLANVAATILYFMNIEKPDIMEPRLF